MRMTTQHKTRALLAGVFALGLSSCTNLKSGDDRPNDADGSVPADGGAGMSGQSGMSGDGGAAGQSGTGPVTPVAPSVTGFTTLGARRSGGGLTLRDDGFEFNGRRCTANGSLCVTGGFEP